MTGSGTPDDEGCSQMEDSISMAKEGYIASERLALGRMDISSPPQMSLASDARLRRGHSMTQNLVGTRRPSLDYTSSVRTPSTSPTRLSQQLLENLSFEKRALKSLEGNLDEVTQRLQSKISQRKSLPPETTVTLRFEDVLELLDCVSKSQDERVKLLSLAESRETIFQRSLKRHNAGTNPSPRLPGGTERSLARSASPYPQRGPHNARQDMLAELRALESLKKELRVLQENLEDAEKRQRQWQRAGLGEDSDIGEEIGELKLDMEVKKENIERLEQNIGHSQEILDGQEDDPPSETSSLLDRNVDSERISRWREGTFAS